MRESPQLDLLVAFLRATVAEPSAPSPAPLRRGAESLPPAASSRPGAEWGPAGERAPARRPRPAEAARIPPDCLAALALRGLPLPFGVGDEVTLGTAPLSPAAGSVEVEVEVEVSARADHGRVAWRLRVLPPARAAAVEGAGPFLELWYRLAAEVGA